MPYRRDDRLELALRASNEGIWDWNVASNEMHYSGRILRFFGRRREASGGRARLPEAGPFERVAGRTQQLLLWPPPEALSDGGAAASQSPS